MAVLNKKEWQETFDIIVIGSGAAGLSAAIEAKITGADVIVFEKMKITGGNTRISDGALAAADNFLQKEKNIEDSPQLFFYDMMQTGKGLNHPELVKTVTEQSAAAIDWTCNELNIRYLNRLDRFGGHSAARCVTTQSHSGIDLIKAMVAKFTSLNGIIRTQCCLKRLITDQSGSITGIEIQEGNQSPDKVSGAMEKKIRARKAVVMATGGFANDIRFRSFLDPRLDDSVKTTNQKGATAEGLIQALDINAFPVHLSHIQLGPWGCVHEKGYGKGGRFASYAVYPAGILIDPVTGLRIANEWGSRKVRSDAILKTGRSCIGIVDAQGAEKELASLAHCLETGKVKAFDTISDLAAAYKIPDALLQKTLNTYHDTIDQGIKDPFGKPLSPSTPKIECPPFYAIHLWPKVHYTSGGVGINSRAEVLDLHQNPIPRLYAAGEVTGGIHGAGRLGGCALTECIVFGRIAGKNAAHTSF